MLQKVKSRFSRLSLAGKVILIGVGLFLLLGMISVASPEKQNVELTANERQNDHQTESASTKTEQEIEKKIITETARIPFESIAADDPNLPEGETTIRTAGIDGIKTLTYEQVFTDGIPGEKVLIKEEITEEPIAQVTAVGTKVAAPRQSQQSCDPNYSGCVPIASDVDCAGGSGNGPAYASGPVYVTGYDRYGLDRDGDGVACE